MENRVHGIHYRLVFTGIGMLPLLALLVLMVWSTITDFDMWGLAGSVIFLVGTGLVFLLFLEAFQDMRQGQSTDAGTVNRKGKYFVGITCEMPVTRESFEDNQELEFSQELKELYSPTDREFRVSKEIYDWISPGDKVIVTYWPHTRILTKIDKTGLD